jgi:hypothetical protein
VGSSAAERSRLTVVAQHFAHGRRDHEPAGAGLGTGAQGLDTRRQSPETVLGQEERARRRGLRAIGQGAEHVGDVVELE